MPQTYNAGSPTHNILYIISENRVESGGYRK